MAPGDIAIRSREAVSCLRISSFPDPSTKSVLTNLGETTVTRSLSPASWRRPSEMTRTAALVAGRGWIPVGVVRPVAEPRRGGNSATRAVLPLIRTEVPGVYRRGPRYVVVYRSAAVNASSRRRRGWRLGRSSLSEMRGRASSGAARRFTPTHLIGLSATPARVTTASARTRAASTGSMTGYLPARPVELRIARDVGGVPSADRVGVCDGLLEMKGGLAAVGVRPPAALYCSASA
jgi:hypothetical protein